MSKNKRARPRKARATARVTKTSVRAIRRERRNSKQDDVLRLLQGPSGATIENVMEATGWQPHSVRAFFASVVRKKLGLNLVSDVRGDERVYRIISGSAKAGRSASKKKT